MSAQENTQGTHVRESQERIKRDPVAGKDDDNVVKTAMDNTGTQG